MSGDKVCGLYAAGVICLGALWGLGAILHGALERNQHLLWPRGTRWFVPAFLAVSYRLRRTGRRILWPETAWELMSPRTRYLEQLDLQWRNATLLWPQNGPVWHAWPNGRGGEWRRPEPEKRRCACGYADECGIWCGAGHLDGRCPAHDDPLGLGRFVPVLQPGEEVRSV